VTAVEDDSFAAGLVDMTAGGRVAEEFAEIPVSNLSDVEREHLAPGAMFDWRIIEGEGGAARSEFVFRTERWTAEELADADRKAQKRHGVLFD
jgi:hypothetical protein